MSLVICSNETEGDASFSRFATNQAPYRFTNHLVSPLEIEEDSEVAVQSIKCNKDGLVKIDADMRFYQFFGRDLRYGAGATATPAVDNVDNSLGWPIACGLKLNNKNMSEYMSVFDFASRLQDGMRTGIPHPDFVDLAPLSKCELLRDGGGVVGSGFKGFQLTYKYKPRPDPSVAAEKLNPPLSWALRSVEEGREQVVVSSNGKTIECKKGKAANGTGMSFMETNKNCVWGKEKPISHLDGVCEYDLRDMGVQEVIVEAGKPDTYHFTKYSKDFVVGLARAVPLTGGGLDKNVPPNVNTGQADGTGRDFTRYAQNTWDYAVSCEQIGQAGNRWLKVGHLTADPLADGNPALPPFAMTDIQYYKGSAPTEFAGSNFKNNSAPAAATDEIGRYNMSSNASHFDTISFKITNEIMTISFKRLFALNGDTPPTYAETAGFPHEVVICSYSMKDAAGFSKLTCPKPVNQACWNMYPKVLLPFKDQVVVLHEYMGRNTGYEAANTEADWYCRELKKGHSNSILSLENRYWNNPADANIFPMLGTSGSNATTGFQSKNMNVILSPQTLNYPYTEEANMQYILGFVGRGVLDTRAATSSEASQQIVFVSDAAPLIQAKDSMFVRLDNFTQSSFNAGVGRPSKILYHLPRFDTSNREIGAGLYFEPQERVYVKLGNTNKTTINELDLSVCNNREQLLTDLTGETIICLHFRKSGSQE